MSEELSRECSLVVPEICEGGRKPEFLLSFKESSMPSRIAELSFPGVDERCLVAQRPNSGTAYHSPVG